jgi:membrane-associated PAP2 superfamily phosphatase
MLNVAHKQFCKTQLLCLIGLALFMLFVYPKTELDAQLIAPYFDATSHSFTLKDNPFLESVMHQGLKNAMLLIALCSLFIGLRASIHAPSRASTLQQYKPFLWVFVGMVIATASVSVLKHFSAQACPWSLSLYGGNAPLIGLLEKIPAGATRGACFPGGHASGGFALWALYFAFRDSQPTFAKIGLFAGAFFGFAMGWAQMMRGAHFLSHNIWSGLVVWFVLLAMYAIWQPSKQNPNA